MELYVANEKYDGYLRDGCVFKKDVNIFDKMAATIKYKNGVQVAYSLTTYSPYEGYRIAFNGTKGRLEAGFRNPNRHRMPIMTKSFCSRTSINGNISRFRSEHPDMAAGMHY